MRNDIPSDSASNFGARVRETLMTYLGKQGDPLDRGVTLRDLVESGFASVSNFQFGGGSAPLIAGSVITDPVTPDLTAPPTPTGFTAAGAITNLIIECDAPIYTQGHGHRVSRIYGAKRAGSAPQPVFTDAVEITQFAGQVTSYATDPATEWHLWIKWESNDGVLSANPAGGTNGFVVTTGQDVAKLLEALTGELTAAQLYADLGARIDLIDAPATYPGSVNARVSAVQAQVNDLQNTPTYSDTVTYATNALVSYLGSIYQAKMSTIGHLPTDTTYWTKVGEYASLGQAVAAHTTQIGNLVSDLGAEVTARQTLSAQVNDAVTGLPATVANLTNNYYTKAGTDSAISSATLSLVSSVDLATALGDYTSTANLINDYYTKADTDSAISSATQYLVSNTDLATSLGDYTSTADLTTNYYTKTDADSAISQATLDLVSTSGLTTALSDYTTTATLSNDYYTKSDADSAISAATTNLVSSTDLSTTLSSYATTATLTNDYYTKSAADSAISTATQNLVSTTTLNNYPTTATLTNNYYTKTATDSAISTATTTLSASTGKSSNVVDNSEFSVDLNGWTSAGVYTFGRNLAGWILDGAGTAYIHQPNQTNTNYDEAYSAKIPVTVGKYYEWSIYTGAHRCTVEAFIYWYNSAGAVVGNTALASNAAQFSGGTTLAGYKRLLSIGAAPANTAYAKGVLRKGPTYSGQGDSWAFFTYAYFGEAGSAQTTATAYSPGSLKGSTSAIQTAASATADTVSGLSAKYTVKVDLNGYVSGFGLASTANDAGATSTFSIRADSFYIASPTGPGITPTMPFIVRTAETDINGETVPAGVYIRDGYIQNGTITNAKIADLAVDSAKVASLSADKITAGSINVGQYIQSSNYVAGNAGWRVDGNGVAEFGAASIRGQLTASQIDTRGLSIKDADGNVIFSAGTALSTANITGLGSLATANTVAATSVTGLGSLATANTVAATSVTGLGTLATANTVAATSVTGLGSLATASSVDWSSQISNIPSFGNFAYLSSITSANISTYIAGVAIGEAYIAEGAITNAKIGTAAVSNAKIGNFIASADFNGTIDSSSNITDNGTVGWAIAKGNGVAGKAVFQNIVARGDIEVPAASINSAKIAELSVGRLQITGGAITFTSIVELTANWSGTAETQIGFIDFSSAAQDAALLKLYVVGITSILPTQLRSSKIQISADGSTWTTLNQTGTSYVTDGESGTTYEVPGGLAGSIGVPVRLAPVVYAAETAGYYYGTNTRTKALLTELSVWPYVTGGYGGTVNIQFVFLIPAAGTYRLYYCADDRVDGGTFGTAQSGVVSVPYFSLSSSTPNVLTYTTNGANQVATLNVTCTDTGGAEGFAAYLVNVNDEVANSSVNAIWTSRRPNYATSVYKYARVVATRYDAYTNPNVSAWLGVEIIRK